MKSVQITMDEELLRRIDADPEAKERGRSAFLRKAVKQYLAAKAQSRVRESYALGYKNHPVQPEEFEVWPDVQAWPSE